jgi:two-component system chemotaxis sensor kinase CheA
MGNISLEPIIELFIEETNGLLEELEKIKQAAIERRKYTLEDVAEIFRITHTIKADATMVLFENIAELLRTFEKLLYFLRDEDPEAPEMHKFTSLLNKISSFVGCEVSKVAAGKEPDLDSKPLCEEILDYLAEVKKIDKNAGHKDSYVDQVYYIASKAENDEESSSDDMPAEENEIAGVKAEEKRRKIGKRAVLYDMVQRNGQNYAISEGSMHDLYEISRDFEGYIREFNIAGGSKLGTVYRRFIEWIDKEYISDFVPIRLKTERVIDEMEKRTGKKVEFSIKGEDIRIEKYKALIIAEAMVHIVRNAVDHGIGTAEERSYKGKSEIGHLSIEIDRDPARSEVVVTVTDDGNGIDLDKVLERAEKHGLLNKDKREYSEEEILRLLFLPGFTTLEIAGVYSGRGVGMDVVRNNIEEIGGRIKMINEPGTGFSISLIVPTCV